MNKLILASAIAAAFVGSVAHAEEAAPASTVAYNVGVATDYRYRGISQSQKEFAVSAGADYTDNVNGFYVGTWISSIKWIKTTTYGGNAPAEVDIYGGKRGEIAPGVSYDVGTLVYLYPNNKLSTDATTWEVYGQVGYGPAYLKYSYALTNTFANVDSKGSYYIDAGVNQPLAEGLTLNLHAGRQVIAGSGNSIYNYNDWKVGVTKDFGVVVGSLAYIGTDAIKSSYTWDGKFVGSNTVVATLDKNF